jgi:hypothetical protein
VLISSLLVAGCGGKAKQADDVQAGTASEVDVAAIRARYQATNPRNRVGVVVATMADANLAAVGDIPVQDFAMGDILTFIDAREEPIATGRVVNATPTELHLRYDAKRRAPRVGDLAVRVAE